MINCRKCGGEAKKHTDTEIDAVAINCSNKDCYNDTHWQNSWHEATKIWNDNPCPVDIRGGQGNVKDDDNIRELNKNE